MNGYELAGPDGQPLLKRDAEWLRRVKGDLTVSYQWIKTGNFPDGIEAMVFWRNISPQVRFALTSAKVCDYAQSKGTAAHGLMTKAIEICEFLGYDVNSDRQSVRRLMDVILDGISDLIMMPPPPDSPEAQLESVGVLTVKANGQVALEVAV